MRNLKMITKWWKWQQQKNTSKTVITRCQKTLWKSYKKTFLSWKSELKYDNTFGTLLVMISFFSVCIIVLLSVTLFEALIGLRYKYYFYSQCNGIGLDSKIKDIKMLKRYGQKHSHWELNPSLQGESLCNSTLDAND